MKAIAKAIGSTLGSAGDDPSVGGSLAWVAGRETAGCLSVTDCS
jgi:hypothetical protein